MRYLILVGLLLSGCATPYIEGGLFYSKDRNWVYRSDTDVYVEESGHIGHIAAGFEWELYDEKMLIDLQLYRHESDYKQTGERDLTDNNAHGITTRYRF